jgi:hypothetical protein
MQAARWLAVAFHDRADVSQHHSKVQSHHMPPQLATSLPQVATAAVHVQNS